MIPGEKEMSMENNNYMVLGNDNYYSMDCIKTQKNNNVLVVGASGSGKTRSIVSPNLMMATGSYIVSDPKGNLHHKYKRYLEKRGYIVKKLDFTDPMNSAHYNFLQYIREPKDITKMAHMLAYNEAGAHYDPFWDQSSELLLSSLISYCIEALDKEKQNFEYIEKLLQLGKRDCDLSSNDSLLSTLMRNYAKKHPKSWAVKQFEDANVAPDRTFNCILITLITKLRAFCSEEITYMTSSDDIDLPSIGQKRTALFVVVSDTDRSMDPLANLFFTQAMNELCWYADHECKDCRLPVPVRFILDDFATNCRIDEFPRMIASIRSRGISTMIMIQAESQLARAYGNDGRTIIGNCDTYIYLGGSDLETAKSIAERCNIPVGKILAMEVGRNIIFRRGEVPKYCQNLDLCEFEQQLNFRNPNTVEKRKIDSRSLVERLAGPEKPTDEEELPDLSEAKLKAQMDKKSKIDASWLFA